MGGALDNSEVEQAQVWIRWLLLSVRLWLVLRWRYLNLLGTKCGSLFVLKLLGIEDSSIFLMLRCGLSVLIREVVNRLLVKNDRLLLTLRLQRNRLWLRGLAFALLLDW